MVQPNAKIYVLPYISEKKYKSLERPISELAKKTKAEIRFDFLEQCFDIKGRSQQACDDTSSRIESHLLPQLNKALDEVKFAGSFEDLHIMRAEPKTPSPSSTPSTPIFGKPLNFDEIDKNQAKKTESRKSSRQNSDDENRPYYHRETESEDSDSADDEYVETFTFAKNITAPKEVLNGLPTNGGQPADYLRIIGNNTSTECSLIGRQVKIVGTSEEAVKEALERFRNLQTIYKRGKRTLPPVPCVHYPTESPPFGLYFCELNLYANQKFVHVRESQAPLHVMLPVFMGANGKYSKPSELLDAPPMPDTQRQWVQQQQQQQQHQQQQNISLEDRMRMATLEHKHEFGNVSAGMAPDQNTLWGENKNYVVNQSNSMARPTTNNPPPAPKPTPQDDFPSLPTTAPRVRPKAQNTRRVLRVSNQKASPDVMSSRKTNADMVREYNFDNIKSALDDGLTGVRGFSGKVTLSAKLGKVLWTGVTPEVKKRIWKVQDIKDIVLKELGVMPTFNGRTTESDEVINEMSEILPQPYSRAANFEIYAKARNQPILPYKPVVMFMSQGVVELKKVVTSTKTITEIDWISLERKFDFQMKLQTEELARPDVKPYNTFIKKVSVSPENCQITYENIPEFLEVQEILLKKTTKYRLHFPFVVEITRVEKLPLIEQKYNDYGIKKMLGYTGKGQVWYDLELFYSTFDEIFKSNNNLPVGKLASWTVNDVLGTDQETNALVEYIRCLLTLVEKCEKVVQ